MDLIDFNLEFTDSSYAGSYSVNLAHYVDWEGVNYRDPVEFTWNGETFYFVVVGKTRTETHRQEVLTVEAKSPAILLDFPYATEVGEDFVVSGLMSEVCNSLAQLEGLSITWTIDVDDPITSAQLQVEGRSPLDCIREVVNALGGIVQSDFDGTIYARPLHEEDTNKYDAVEPAAVFTSGEDFISLQDETDKRDGFNRYTVTNISSEASDRLVAEEVTPSHYILKGYRIPWSNEAVTCTTSELTNVTIVPVPGPTVENVTQEDIEVVDGEASVDLPCYGNITWDYATSTDLGAVSITEDGTLTTATSGDTIVTVSYDTKYWKWDAYDPDIEKVQFIMEPV